MEARGFRDRSPELERLGATIVGASFDPPAVNLAFAQAEDLPFTLLSDVDGSVATAYGARRRPGSRWIDVPERRTYLIDPDGVVRVVYDVTNVSDHPGQVVDDLRRLSTGDRA